MKNENRPWVGFELQQLNTAKRGEPLTALVKIRNVGKSPAMNVHGQVRIGDLTLMSADGVAECRGCSHSLLLPGADATYPPITMTAEQTDYKNTRRQSLVALIMKTRTDIRTGQPSVSITR
jgi:hypothetical protein